jgi:hypothetical protein
MNGVAEAVSGLTPVQWTFFGVVVVAVAGVVGTILTKRLRARPSEPEMWERVDKLTAVIYGDGKRGGDPGLLVRVKNAEDRADGAERKAEALGNIIKDLTGQWAGPRPRLNPRDLAELDEKYMPATHPWRQKPRAERRANKEVDDETSS